ncbi:MAG: glycine cleavage system aminomethyltransferase GcvT [Kiritimatiellae bacterium]|jgi:aminomethyltransferase|nr:glycine cleavage system aminomethyltransferase GcvT [Kiritimatiellia bacterium]
MNDDMDLKKTCLYELHVELGARMASFGGWLMPLQYSGILKEHAACRVETTLFDTDHMGEFCIWGESALADLENLVSCDVASMTEGQCRYGMMCNPEGGVVDDLLVYRLGDTEFMLVVNAGTKDDDLKWIDDHLSGDTQLKDLSDEMAKIDLQGPKSPKIIQQLFGQSIEGLKFYRFMHNQYRDTEVMVSRTGYTGEMGFEIYLKPDLAQVFWKECMELGAVPAGLGARDTLRLEMGMPLYGREMDAERNAGESGFERAISVNKSYIGSAVVVDKSSRVSKLVGIKISGRRAARHGDDILDASGVKIGSVSSGSFAPSIGCAVALGYVDVASAEAGTKLVVKSPRYELEGEVVKTPFYGEATGRRKVTDFL